MASIEQSIDELPVCTMCRAALHKFCEKGRCACNCLRGW